MGNQVYKTFYTRAQTHSYLFHSTFLNELICINLNHKDLSSHHTRGNDFAKLTIVFHNSVCAVDSHDLNHLRERAHLDKLGLDGGMILKQFLKKHGGR
jgi:hypothetical protein